MVELNIMRLANKTIVVTGASSGLGKAIADEFVREGATVLYSSYESRPLEDAVGAISKQEVEGRSIAVLADVQSWDDIAAWFNTGDRAR